jgi:hypothetical protein
MLRAKTSKKSGAWAGKPARSSKSWMRSCLLPGAAELARSLRPQKTAVNFELWDLASRNVFGYFETKDEALQAVRQTLERYGSEQATGFLLVSENAKGVSRAIADGKRLVDLAFATNHAKRPVAPVAQRETG